VEQVFISRVSHPVPNIVIYIYQNPTNPGVRATKRFTNDMVCLLRKPSKTEARKQPVKVRKWTNLKNILRISPSTPWIFKIKDYLCNIKINKTFKTMLTKEQYIAKEIKLTAAYEAADKAFDKNPCKETATALSNSRQALKTLRAEGYVGRDRELSRQLAKDVAQVFNYAAGRTNELPTVFK
jgi:hypothetical protein